jgi:hypothetical protein
MNSKKLSILLVVITLMISISACAFGEPTLSNVRTTKDENGNQASTIFSTTDTIYVVGNLSNGVKGNVVSCKWIVSNVNGYKAGYVINQSDFTLEQNAFSYAINFYITPPIPAGAYKVEIYFNGALNATIDFTVQ